MFFADHSLSAACKHCDLIRITEVFCDKSDTVLDIEVLVELSLTVILIDNDNLTTIVMHTVASKAVAYQEILIRVAHYSVDDLLHVSDKCSILHFALLDNLIFFGGLGNILSQASFHYLHIIRRVVQVFVELRCGL